jgi:hypothetical protein
MARRLVLGLLLLAARGRPPTARADPETWAERMGSPKDKQVLHQEKSETLKSATRPRGNRLVGN